MLIIIPSHPKQKHVYCFIMNMFTEVHQKESTGQSRKTLTTSGEELSANSYKRTIDKGKAESGMEVRRPKRNAD